MWFCRTKKLDAFEEDAKNIKNKMVDPIVILFNTIEDLEEMAKAADTKFSKTQLVNRAAQIIKMWTI